MLFFFLNKEEEQGRGTRKGNKEGEQGRGTRKRNKEEEQGLKDNSFKNNEVKLSNSL